MSAGTEHTSLEQRLKAQIDRYPVRLRPGLASEAYRAHRWHRVVRRSAAAAGTAVVIAAAATLAVTGTVPFSAAPGGPQPSPASSLPPGGGVPPAGLRPTPPSDGLTASQAARDIVWERTTTYVTPARNSYVTDTFSYGDRNREIIYQPNGKPREDSSSRVVTVRGGPAGQVRTNVDYLQRAWLRLTLLSSAAAQAIPQTPCQAAQASGLADVNYAADPGATARSLTTCPGLRVTGNLTFDGISALKITGPQDSALVVNAATYLPVEVDIVSRGLTAAAPVAVQFGYLSPTAANLAYLSARIPAGFKGSAQSISPDPPGKTVPITPWTPPPGVIPPFGAPLAPAGDGLTARQAAAGIMMVRTTTMAIPASDTVQDDSFWYRSASRDLTYYPDGKPWDDSQVATIRGADGTVTTYDTVVNYDSRSWSRQVMGNGTTTVAPARSACATARSTGLADISFQATPDAARSLLSCQGQVVTRGLTLDGVGAIKVAGKLGETLWINATTYLPIEIVVIHGKGDMPPAGYNSARSPEQVSQYTWLPPTPANLAYLGIPIPSGFAVR